MACLGCPDPEINGHGSACPDNPGNQWGDDEKRSDGDGGSNGT